MVVFLCDYNILTDGQISLRPLIGRELVIGPSQELDFLLDAALKPINIPVTKLGYLIDNKISLNFPQRLGYFVL